MSCKALKLVVPCLAMGLLWGCQKESASEPTPTFVDEAYKAQIELTSLGLASGENFLGEKVYYVEGTLANKGEKLVQQVELSFEFRDSLNQVVLQDTRKAIDYKGERGIAAQTSTEFQVAFDSIPKDWNRRVPDVQVTSVTVR